MDNDPQDSLVTSTEDVVLVGCISKPDSDLIFQKGKPRKKKLKETNDNSLWYQSLCRSALETSDISKLVDLMSQYTEHISKDVTASYSRPKRAAKVKKSMIDTLSFIHSCFTNIKKPDCETEYLEKMSHLLTMYVDMEIKASRRGKESVKKITSKIVSSLFIFLKNSTQHILDTVLKIRFAVKIYSEICSIIFKRVTSLPVCDDTDYIRHLFIFKLWKRVVPKEERNSLNKLAVAKLSPPSLHLMEMVKRGLLSKILPILPPNKKPALVTRFYMTSRIILRDAINTFLSLEKDLNLYISEITFDIDIENNQQPFDMTSINCSNEDDDLDIIWEDITSSKDTNLETSTSDIPLSIPGMSDMFETPKTKNISGQNQIMNEQNSNKSKNRNKKSNIKKKKSQEREDVLNDMCSESDNTSINALEELELRFKMENLESRSSPSSTVDDICSLNTNIDESTSTSESVTEKSGHNKIVKCNSIKNERQDADLATSDMDILNKSTTDLERNIGNKMLISCKDFSEISYTFSKPSNPPKCNNNKLNSIRFHNNNLSKNGDILVQDSNSIMLCDSSRKELGNISVLEDSPDVDNNTLNINTAQSDSENITYKKGNENDQGMCRNLVKTNNPPNDKLLRVKSPLEISKAGISFSNNLTGFKPLINHNTPKDNIVVKSSVNQVSDDGCDRLLKSTKFGARDPLSKISEDGINLNQYNRSESVTDNNNIKEHSPDTSCKSSTVREQTTPNYGSKTNPNHSKLSDEAEISKSECTFVGSLEAKLNPLSQTGESKEKSDIQNSSDGSVTVIKTERSSCFLNSSEIVDNVHFTLCDPKMLHSKTKAVSKDPFSMQNELSIQSCPDNSWPAQENVYPKNVTTKYLHSCLLHTVGEENCLTNMSTRCVHKEVQSEGSLQNDIISSEEAHRKQALMSICERQLKDMVVTISENGSTNIKEEQNLNKYQDCNAVNENFAENPKTSTLHGNVIDMSVLENEPNIADLELEECDYDCESEDSNLIIDEDVDIAKEENEIDCKKTYFDDINKSDEKDLNSDVLNNLQSEHIEIMEDTEKATTLGKGSNIMRAVSSETHLNLRKNIFSEDLQISSRSKHTKPNPTEEFNTTKLHTNAQESSLELNSFTKENLVKTSTGKLNNEIAISPEKIVLKLLKPPFTGEIQDNNDIVLRNNAHMSDKTKTAGSNSELHKELESHKLFSHSSLFEKNKPVYITVKSGETKPFRGINNFVLDKSKVTNINSCQVRKPNCNNFISVKENPTPRPESISTPGFDHLIKFSGNNTNKQIYVKRDKRLCGSELQGMGKNQDSINNIELREKVIPVISSFNTNSLNFIPDSVHLSPKRNNGLNLSSKNSTEIYSSKAVPLVNPMKITGEHILNSNPTQDTVNLMVRNRDDSKERVCDFEFNVFPVAQEIEVCSVTENTAPDWISLGANEIGHPDWPIGHEQSVVDSSNVGSYARSPNQYLYSPNSLCNSNTKGDPGFAVNENERKSLDLQDVTVDFIYPKSFENDFDTDKYDLHIKTLEADYNLCSSQHKFKEFYSSEDVSPSIPVPFPPQSRADSANASVRCGCEQCFSNHQKLINNYNILTHFRNIKSNSLNTLPKTDDDKEQTVELDCSLPLKKRKTLTSSKSEDPNLLSYPNTPMISIAQLELANYKQRRHVIVSNPQSLWEDTRDTPIDLYNPLNLAQNPSSLAAPDGRIKNNKRKHSKRRKSSRYFQCG